MDPILGPDPHGMDPEIGPKISPGRILIKPEALLRDLEYEVGFNIVCPDPTTTTTEHCQLGSAP